MSGTDPDGQPCPADGPVSTDGPEGLASPRLRSAPGRPVSYRQLLAAYPEFRTLWSAQVLSYIGSQIAQAVIAILVYARTGSPLLAAIAYAVAYLTPIVGGPLLAGAVGWYPPRRLLIIVDLLRAALVAAMAAPAIPLYAVCTLLFAAALLGPLHAGARSALLPDVLPSDAVVPGAARANVTFHASQIGGFLLAGVLVATLGPHRALALDALPFAVSVALVARGIFPRPAPATPPPPRPLWPALRRGTGIVFGRPELRALVLFGWLAGFTVVPEGLAAPYAHALGGGPITVGLLMSAMPAGMIAGAAVIQRCAASADQVRMVGGLSILSCAPLILCLANPPSAVLVPLWVLAGAGAAYQLTAASAFVRALPCDENRRQAFTVAQSGLLGAQGLAILVAGAIAVRVGPQPVVAFAGVLGVTCAGALTANWARHRNALAAEVGEQDAVGQ